MVLEMSGENKILVRYNDFPDEISSQVPYQKFKLANVRAVELQEKNLCVAGMRNMFEVDVSSKNS